MSEPATQQVPPAPIHRIDWLAIAPWVILLRVPGATLGWPFVVGALASVALSQGELRVPAAVGDLSGHTASAMAAFSRLPTLFLGGFVGDRAAWSGWLSLLGCLGAGVGWAVASLLVVSAAARWLTGLHGVPNRERRVLFSLRWATSLFGALGLLAIAVGTLAGLFWLVGRFALLHDVLAAIVVPVGSLLIGLPLALLLLGTAVGWPLLLAAIVVDDADAFDACSRAASYASQRLGRLAFYLVVAAAVGVFAGMLLELIIAMVLACTEFCVRRPPAGAPLRGAAEACLDLARGFYPAYFFTAWTAIYLLLRRDIDGQPIDEMATPAEAQPSVEA